MTPSTQLAMKFDAKILEDLGVRVPPTEEELPYSDGMPMESDRHISQMHLLIETLENHWKDRTTGFAGGNMFVYSSVEQLMDRDFRGPDFFAVLNAPKRERKSWVCWQEGMGPDVVIELLSASTAAIDKGEKKRVYQDELRVPEYYWYGPFNGELAGFALDNGKYRALEPDGQGRLRSEKLGLELVKWKGVHEGIEAEWLRWRTPEGVLLPTGREEAAAAEFRASVEHSEREEAERQALAEKARREEAERQNAELIERMREMEAELERLRERKP